MRVLAIVALGLLAAGCSCGDVRLRDDAGADAPLDDAGSDAPDAPIAVPSCEELFAAPIDEMPGPTNDFTCEETTIPLAMSHLQTWSRWPVSVLRSCWRVTRASPSSGWVVGDVATSEGTSLFPWIAGPDGEVAFDTRAFLSDGSVTAQEIVSLHVGTPVVERFAERLLFAAEGGAIRATATEVNVYGRIYPATEPRVFVSAARDAVWIERTATGARFSLARGTEDVVSIELPGVPGDADVLLPDGSDASEWVVVSGTRALEIRRSEDVTGPLELDREITLDGGELATAHALRDGDVLALVGDEVLRFDRLSGARVETSVGVRALLDHAIVRTDGSVEEWSGDASVLAFDVSDLDAAGTLLALSHEVLVGTMALVAAREGSWAPHPGPRRVPWSVLPLDGTFRTAHSTGDAVSLVLDAPDGGSIYALLDPSFRGCD